MDRTVKARWEHTSDEFQETADVSVGLNWGWDDVDDEDVLGDVDGLDVLELGCGGGQDTVSLAERGASVTGIDLSREQLGHAVELFDEREDYPNLVTYRRTVSDVHTALRETGFDVEQLLEPGSPDPDDHEDGPWGDSPAALRAKLPRVLVVVATAR